jgi:hypothetical protein
MIIPSRTRLLEAPRALCRNLDKHPAVTFNAATIHIIRQTAETVIREALTELATKPEEARN